MTLLKEKQFNYTLDKTIGNMDQFNPGILQQTRNTNLESKSLRKKGKGKPRRKYANNLIAAI